MRARLFAAAEYLRSRLWFIPLVGVSVAVAAAVLANELDRRVDPPFLKPVFDTDPDAAQAILTVIASSMLTFTALVFTITVVVVQQAGTQFSPRVIRAFLRERMSKVTLAVFMGTFAFALQTLRTLEPAGEEPFVPGISIGIAFALVLLSLGVFVYYLNHVAQSLRVATIIEGVTGETRALLQRLCAPLGPGDGVDEAAAAPAAITRRIMHEERGRTLVAVQQDRLVELAARHDAAFHVAVRLGDFVPQGAVLVEVEGEVPADVDGAVRAALELAAERTMRQDLAFGFRQLVDIGERALSSGVNDPTTAVQVLDGLHDLLRQLVVRELPPTRYRDRSGRTRLTVPGRTWEDYLGLALDELRRYGADSLQVPRRMRDLLDDLLTVAPYARRPPIEEQLRRLQPR